MSPVDRWMLRIMAAVIVLGLARLLWRDWQRADELADADAWETSRQRIIAERKASREGRHR